MQTQTPASTPSQTQTQTQTPASTPPQTQEGNFFLAESNGTFLESIKVGNNENPQIDRNQFRQKTMPVKLEADRFDTRCCKSFASKEIWSPLYYQRRLIRRAQKMSAM